MGKNIRQGVSNVHSASPDEGFGDFFEKTLIFCNFCNLSGKVSHFCKTFTARFPKHQSKCPGKLFAKTFFCKTVGIILFPFLERKNRGSWLKIYDEGFETITYMSRETIWETFYKGRRFFNRFCTLSEFSSTLCKAISAGVVETTFGVSRGKLWGFFIEKRMIFHIFLRFEQNRCWLLPNIYGSVSQISIYVSGETFWEKK